MGKRQAIKNIKRVSCRFDMDVPEERRAWQILQGNYREPPDGKKQDYTSIIAKAMIGHYDREEETHLTNEELLKKIQESIRRETEGIKKNIPQATGQAEIQQNEEAINDAALDFMDSFMGG